MTTDRVSAKASSAIVLATAAITAAHGLCLLWDADGSGPALARALRTVFGMYVLMLGPGAIVALCIAGKSRLSGLAFLSTAWASNVSLLIVGTTAIKACGLALNPWVCYGLVAVLLVAGLVWYLLKRSRCDVALPSARSTAHVAAAMLLCPLLIFATRRPLLVADHSYWPLETERRLHQLGAKDDFADHSFSVTYSSEWRLLAKRRYEIATWPAKIRVHNRRAGPALFTLKLLVESHTEGTLSLVHERRIAASAYLHPRFIRTAHPRNYPPPNAIVAHTFSLRPGQNQIDLQFDREDEGGGPTRVVVSDLTGLRAREARRIFNRHYLVAAIGDVQSNLSLSRNFSDHLWLFTHSYNGSRFDRGGYTISNLPFPYYVDNLALLLMGDSPMSLDVLYLALLGSMVAVLVGVAGCWGSKFRIRYVWLTFGSMLCYGTVMRLHIESLYVHTILTFCSLLCAHHFLRGERLRFLIYAMFVCLCKGGLVVVGLLLILGIALMAGQRKRMLADAAAVLAIVAAGLVAFWCAKQAWPSLAAWQIEARSDEYAGRFNIIRDLWDAPWRKSLPLWLAGGKLTLWVLLVSCFAPLELCRGRDRRALLLFGVGLAFHLIVCASDPCVVSLSAIQHPLNYFVPAAPLMLCAGLRGMSVGQRRPGWLHALVCCVCLLGCLHVAQTHDRPWRVPKHAAMHACALSDFLIRRAILRIGAGDYALALRDAERGAALCEPHRAEKIVPEVYSHGLVVQAHAALMLSRMEEATKLLHRALDAYKPSEAALRGLCSRLRREGHGHAAAAVAKALASLKKEGN